MPNLTPNLSLKKPLKTESYTITDVTNDNMDILDSAIDGKQAELVSGTNIKTLNSTSLLGSGDVTVQEVLVSGTNIKSINGASILGSGNLAIEIPLSFALSDEVTGLTTGTSKLTYRIPYACQLSKLPRINLNTASSSGLVTVDINKNGTSIFTTLLTIDASEKTSVTATTIAVLNATPVTFADDDEITFDIDVAGTGAKGLKATLYIERT